MFLQPLPNLRPDEVLVYLRKSRSDDPTLTVEEVLQRHETMIDEWSQNNLGGTVPEENKLREVVSGETITDRPQMRSLLRKIESPKYKAVLVVEVQRLSRGDLMDAGLIIRTFRYTNTLAITLQRTFNVQDEYERESFERELKRGNEYLEYQKRIMANGRLLSVKLGNYLGSIPPYGYNRIKITENKRERTTLSINEEQANIVRLIFDLFVNQDLGIVTICRRLDSLGITPPKGKYWACDGVRSILKNVHYIGKVRWNRRKTVNTISDGVFTKTRPIAEDENILIYDGKHPAIISNELFEQAQQKLGRNTRQRPGTTLRNPFAGLLYCSCGTAMVMKKSGKDIRYSCNNQVHCKSGSCLPAELQDSIKYILKKYLKDAEINLGENNSSYIHAQKDTIAVLENKLKELEAKELSQWEMQSDPNPANRMPADIFSKLNEQIQKEKKSITRSLQEVYKTIPDAKKVELRIFHLKNALDALNNQDVSAEAQNKALKECIWRIIYTRGPKSHGLPKGVADIYTTQSKGWYSPPFHIDVQLRF